MSHLFVLSLRLMLVTLLVGLMALTLSSAQAQDFSKLNDPTAQQWIDTFDEVFNSDLALARESLSQLLDYALENEDPEALAAYAHRVISHFRYADDIPTIIEDLETFQQQHAAKLSVSQALYFQLAVASLHIQEQTRLNEAEQTLLSIEKNPDAGHLQAFAKKALGDLYQTLGQYPQSLAFYTAALRLDQRDIFRANVYNNLGNVSSYLEDWGQSIDYYQNALALYESLGQVNDQIAVQANLGATYRAAGQPELALETYQQGLVAVASVDSPDLEAQLQMNLGNLYVDLNQAEAALTALNRSLDICLTEAFSYCVLLNHLNIGYVHYVNQNYVRALESYDLAMDDLEAIDDPYIERQLMKNYADLYRDLGDFEAALTYAERYQQLDRQLINAEAKASAEEIQTRYETELKDAELAFQAEQIERQRAQIQIGIISAAGIVSVLAVVIFFLSFRTRALQSLYERNQDLLRQNEVNQRLAAQRQVASTEPSQTRPELASPSLELVFERLTTALQRDVLYQDPNLTLNDLASHVASNSTYVSTAISQYANTNFNNLVNYYRIMDARRRLNQGGPNTAIAELVHACGFNSKASFYRAFSKFVGMTPSQYVQRLKANQGPQAPSAGVTDPTNSATVG